MTNEQLGVLLEQYRVQLEAALAEADAGLPEEIERHTRWEYIGGASIFGLERVLSTPSRHPDDWKQTPGAACVLDPLHEVLYSLEMSIGQLRGCTLAIPERV